MSICAKVTSSNVTLIKSDLIQSYIIRLPDQLNLTDNGSKLAV